MCVSHLDIGRRIRNPRPHAHARAQRLCWRRCRVNVSVSVRAMIDDRAGHRSSGRRAVILVATDPLPIRWQGRSDRRAEVGGHARAGHEQKRSTLPWRGRGSGQKEACSSKVFRKDEYAVSVFSGCFSARAIGKSPASIPLLSIKGLVLTIAVERFERSLPTAWRHIVPGCPPSQSQ